MKQQAETYKYFNSVSEEWSRKVRDSHYSVMNNRHSCLFEAIGDLYQGSVAPGLVDLGCGTGELVVQACRRSIPALGVDFSETMIEKCIASTNEFKDNYIVADILADSFWKTLDNVYKIFSGFGLVEYMSESQMDELFKRVFLRISSSGGLAVIGSRNRLFNFVSANDFTRAEASLGSLDKLLDEVIAFSSAESFPDLVARLISLENPARNLSSHTNTGIGVSVRYQYTPATLLKKLAAVGFTRFKLYPVHMHAILPISCGGDEFVQLRRAFARDFEKNFITSWKLIPQCSSFVIAAGT